MKEEMILNLKIQYVCDKLKQIYKIVATMNTQL